METTIAGYFFPYTADNIVYSIPLMFVSLVAIEMGSNVRDHLVNLGPNYRITKAYSSLVRQI